MLNMSSFRDSVLVQIVTFFWMEGKGKERWTKLKQCLCEKCEKLKDHQNHSVSALDFPYISKKSTNIAKRVSHKIPI